MECVVCHRRPSWRRKGAELLKCRDCGHVRATNRFFKIDPRKIYERNYFESMDYADYEMERPALERNFADRIRRIRNFKKKGRLLEIGCAFGYFLNMADKFFETEGIEIDPEIANVARKNSKHSRIYAGEFLRRKFKDDRYDIICMLDTIEHLKRPDLYVRKISKILKSDGILVIETGDMGSILSRIQGPKWRLITPPTHLHYFSEQTLERTLSTYGLTTISSNYVPFARSVRQTLHRLLRKRATRYLPSPILNTIFTINTYDLLFNVAQKKSPRPRKA